MLISDAPAALQTPSIMLLGERDDVSDHHEPLEWAVIVCNFSFEKKKILSDWPIRQIALS